MLKKFLLINIILCMCSLPVIAEEKIGNDIQAQEFPHSDHVLPKNGGSSDYIISGSVEKNIDLTLENCIELALGNNTQINAAFQDILAYDARIKQVWSNYFPQISWQTGDTKIRQLKLSDALEQNLTFNEYNLGKVT